MASFFQFPRMSSFKKRRPGKRPFPIKRSRKKTRVVRARKRTFKGRRKGRTTTVKTLAKRVTALSKSVDQGLAMLTYRRLNLGSFNTGVGKQLTQSVNINSQGQLNDSLDSVSYFDSSTNTIVQIDASDSATTYQRDYNFKYMGVKVTLTNNQTTACTLEAALVRPINDTSVTPLNAYLAGLFDNNNLDKDSVLVKWSDSVAYNEMWTNIVKKTVVLQSGQSIVLSTNLGAIKYSPQTAEADSLQYRKDEKPCALMIRLQGPIARDSIVVTEHSYAPASLQYEIETIFKIEYDAGLSIKRTRTVEDDVLTAFSNEGTVGQKPVAGQQTFNSGIF